MLTVPSDWSFKKDFPRAYSQAARVCVQIYISVGDTACVSDLHNQRGEAVHTYVHTVSSPTRSRIQFLNYRHFFCGPFSSHDNAEKRESSHPTPGLKHMSTGYETCKLTATPKSPARWCGSQSAHSTVMTARHHTTLPFGKSALVLSAHEHPSRVLPPYVFRPRVPHTLHHPSPGSVT